MNISICLSNTVRDNDFAEIISKIGYAGVDFNICREGWKTDVDCNEFIHEIKSRYEILQRHNIPVIQTHLPYYPGHIDRIGNGSYEDFEAVMLKKFIKGIEVTGEMGCHIAVIHPFEGTDIPMVREGNLKMINKLLPYLEKHNVSLALENIYFNNYSDSGMSTADDMLYYTNKFDSQYIGLCFDSGHALVRKQNPVDMLAKIIDKVIALHIHTNDGNKDMHLIPYMLDYLEETDWKKLAGILKENKYKGTFNLELRPTEKIGINAVESYYKLAFEVAKNIIE